MAGPSPEQIEHYVRLFERLSQLPPDPGATENLCWTVVRGPGMTVQEAVRRLNGDPAALTTRRPAEDSDDFDLDEGVFLEQRGDAVVIVGYLTDMSEVEVLQRLSRGATLHTVFWMINNYSGLLHLVDGELITEVDPLDPTNPQGADPDALNDHLDALRALHAQPLPGPDWETAMATLESLTGERLDIDWFTRPQAYAETGR
ncbi:hypothetical protein SAMN05443665_101450 [Actinomadura meyerae]|jgi:hypothetical protein|uniref:Uncharacterized protein n=1 Tax=Actinomadura meyerae TaxID=240840 RepID=A0A239J790_9ACTN|nr:DUF6461 domain-containing protein [Actinomadura meyerae]SNT01639.1 hypothetical protein SAMN05443665_101450 [Actinomadura meyerae]